MSTVSLKSLHSDDGKSSTGLDESIAVLLAYLFWWVGGLVFFFLEKKSKFVKFHAMQSLIFGGVLFVVWLIFDIIGASITTAAIMSGGIGAIGAVSAFGIIATILMIATWAVVIWAIVYAVMKKDFVMPIIGEQAYKIATK